MKKILIAMCAVAAMASCSKNEVVESAMTQQEMTFGVVKGNSVATKTTTGLETDEVLGVYAFSGNTAFDGIENEKLSYISSAWALPTTHYYPVTGDVTFWAYGEDGKDVTNSEGVISEQSCDATNGPAFTVTIPAATLDADVYATQAVATGSASTATTAPVTFALQRVLASLVVKAQLSDAAATDITVKITAVTVSASTSGEYANKVWTSAGSSVDYSLSSTTSSISTDAAEFGSVNLVPYIDTYPTINVTGAVYQNDVAIRTLTAETELTAFAAGSQYTYTLQVSPTGTAITFGQPTVTDWTEESDANQAI